MNNFSQIPKDLQDSGLFCLWKYEKRNGQDKPTKVPYRVNGERAKSNDKNSFTNFATIQKYISNYDGLGIGIFSGYSAIDIDHCIDDKGQLSNLAIEITNLFNDCYTEISPSGHGLRIIFKTNNFKYDTKKYYINNSKLGLEVYVSGATSKFVTITGNVYKKGEIICATNKLQILLDKYMQRQLTFSKTSISQQSYLSDEQVIERATHAKNGKDFLSLWNGEINGKQSHSEADLALCSHLAFWCGGDIEQMDRLFRRSGLMREKWEREDYRMATLQKAVSGNTKIYKPIEFLENNDLLDKLTIMDIQNNQRYTFSDIGSGRLLADVYF